MEHGDYAKHLLVVFVVAHDLGVCVEKRHVLIAGEVAREFVYIYGLVIYVGIFIAECLFGHEVEDVAFRVDCYHRAVHPCLVFCHEGEVGVRMVDNHFENAVFEYQVGLEQKSVILTQLIFGERERIYVVCLVVYRIVDIFDVDNALVAVADVFLEPVALVAYDKYKARQAEARQLSYDSVDKCHSVYFDHTFCMSFCQVAQAASHSGRQYYRLHSMI